MKGKTIVTNRRDCSSYLWACLVQSGHFDVSTVKYTSSSYLPGGDATEAMEEAGFIWYPSSEISAEDLQAGDVLVRNGHVEISLSLEWLGVCGTCSTAESRRRGFVQRIISAQAGKTGSPYRREQAEAPAS